MTTGVVLLNFGEPAEPTCENVVGYLERIFLNNASLDGDSVEQGSTDDGTRTASDETTKEAARERSRELAERRAPSLIEEYESIGGSPLNPQADAQADVLADELESRGFDVETYVGMQFTEPFIPDAVERAHADGVDRLIGLPIYPLCGPSTTVASLEELNDAVEERGWDVEIDEVTGWHRHPTYNRLRADNVAAYLDDHDLSLHDDDTELVFSAHGTPRYYLERGSRYGKYVEEFCDVMAAELGVEDYTLGFQNHGNRDIDWTEPEVEDAIAGVDAERVVVEPISFMHEQSETLSELDDELADEAAELGLEFHRVPVPHDDERFGSLLADLVEPFVAGFDPGYYNMRQCQCKDTPGTVCLNAER